MLLGSQFMRIKSVSFSDLGDKKINSDTLLFSLNKKKRKRKKMMLCADSQI